MWRHPCRVLAADHCTHGWTTRDISVKVNIDSDASPEAPSLIDRLRAATEHFEESHPDLTAVTGRIADLLARMGI